MGGVENSRNHTTHSIHRLIKNQSSNSITDESQTARNPQSQVPSPNHGNDRNLGLLYNLVGIETLPLNLASACGSAFYGRAAPRRSSIVLRPPRSERTRWSSPRGLPGRPPVPSRARAPCGVCVNSFDSPSRPSGDPGGPRRAESLATRSASAILASTLPTRNKTAGGAYAVSRGS